MRALRGWSLKDTKKVIAEIRKSLKESMGLDSVSFIKIEVVSEDEELLEFNVKAKNGCGYKSCDVDDFILVNPNTKMQVVDTRRRQMLDKTDGIIKNDGSERPTYFGMWQRSWTSDSYMWKDGNTVYMSHMVPTKIASKARFAVIDHLHRHGYEVIIPNPSIFVWPEEPFTLGLETITISGAMGNIVALKKPAKK